MGSHGGPTAEGQLDVLAEFGIAPESMGCEIRSSMDTGKQKGADTFHGQGFAVFDELIPEVAAYTLSRAPIPFGLIENGHARLLHVEAVTAYRIRTREPGLLVMSTDALTWLPPTAIDVPVLDQIGKAISEPRLDSNVVGRYYAGPTGAAPAIRRIVVRDLTGSTHGNAVGIGMADAPGGREGRPPQDIHELHHGPRRRREAWIPLTVDTDREALAIALACCLRVTPDTARIVRVRDAKHVEFLYVSVPAVLEVLTTGMCELVKPLGPIAFDAARMFVDRLT